MCVEPFGAGSAVCPRKVDIEELERLSKKGSSTAWATNALTPTEAPASST
ncbi:4339_t:CDS:1, partial [Acaulospora colombiana]